MKAIAHKRFATAALAALIIGCGAESRRSDSGEPDTRWYTANPKATNFTISTADQLAGLAAIVNGTWGGEPEKDSFEGKTIILANDVDLSVYGENYNDGKGWVPIGKYKPMLHSPYIKNPFSGVFDGYGKVVSGLYINDDKGGYSGLFGYVVGGEIKNLGVVDVNIKSSGGIGGVAGWVQGSSRIANCYTTGNIHGAFSQIGGVAGYIWESSVSDCYSTAEVSGDVFVGGVVGIVLSGSVLTNCYSAGMVSGNAYVGGVAGDSYQADIKMSNCAALNPSVARPGRDTTHRPLLGFTGRVTGSVLNNYGVLSDNAAYYGMTNNAGNIEWADKGADKVDGADITAGEINADGTIGGRFTGAGGWTTKPGRLPGLFGKTVAIPAHLSGSIAAASDNRAISTKR